jgi:glycosyltransferase involved in cell wall biosynthesis
MIELARRLDRTRWDVHVASMRGEGAWFDRVASAAPVTVFPISSFKRPHVLGQLTSFAAWCRDKRIQIVHTSDLPSNIFGLPAAWSARVPVRIGNRRDINPGKSTLEILMQRTAYTCAHRIVANSQAAAERLLYERVPAGKIRVIANGLECGHFPPPAPRLLLRNVVVVANLRPEKGHDLLIDAAKTVLQSFPDATFTIVGNGSEREALVARVKAHGIEHAVRFLGHQDNVPARLAEADIFVLPSRSEAFPNAVLEAMASGLPVVTTGVGGMLELVRDGRSGFLVPPGDVNALVDRLSLLMSDAALGARLGAAARADAQSRYSFEQMVTAFDAVYCTELTRRGRLRPANPPASTRCGVPT